MKRRFCLATLFIAVFALLALPALAFAAPSEPAKAEPIATLQEGVGGMYALDMDTLDGVINLQVAGRIQGKSSDDTKVVYSGNGPVRLGTTGSCKRLETFSVKIAKNSTGISGSLRYRAHVQDQGWTDWASAGKKVGTVGKRIEAIQLEFTGQLKDYYDIIYRTHVQEIGWEWWSSNGSLAGTAGLCRRIEAIDFVVDACDEGSVPHDSNVNYPFIEKPSVEYRAHVQGIGWQGWKKDGALAGTSGQSRRIEAFNIRLNPKPGNGEGEQYAVTGDVQYRAHVQGIGWQNWVKNGALAGTSGQSKRVEAISIKLTGDMAKQCNIYYRVHVQGIGWMGWAKDGQDAGTSGMSRRIEGMQIKIVHKGGKAPGSTANHFKSK